MAALGPGRPVPGLGWRRRGHRDSTAVHEPRLPWRWWRQPIVHRRPCGPRSRHRHPQELGCGRAVSWGSADLGLGERGRGPRSQRCPVHALLTGDGQSWITRLASRCRGSAGSPGRPGEREPSVTGIPVGGCKKLESDRTSRSRNETPGERQAAGGPTHCPSASYHACSTSLGASVSNTWCRVLCPSVTLTIILYM